MLNKPKSLAIASTNLALFGTSVERSLKENNALKEPAWEQVAQAPEDGIKVWRVVKFRLVPWAQVGTFYEGDAFVVLATTKSHNEFLYDAHFWLGRECSQDEAGVAAYKTVELDEVLHGKAIQHREVQGCESSLFLSYFQSKGGLILLKGGVDSGFRKVAPEEYKPRLMMLHGKRQISVQEVPLERSSLNEGNAFVLDQGLVIYKFQGASCNPRESTKASEVASSLKAERDGKPRVVVVSQLDDPTKDDDVKQFWDVFGGYGEIAKAVPDVDEPETAQKILLFEAVGPAGACSLEKKREGDLNKSDLKSDEVYVIHAQGEVYVWVGSKASDDVKKMAMAIGQKYLQDSQLPNYTPLSRVLEGSETPYFWSVLQGQTSVPKFGSAGSTSQVTKTGSSSRWAPVKTGKALK